MREQGPASRQAQSPPPVPSASLSERRVNPGRVAIVMIAACAFAVTAFARAEISNHGEWPSTWPSELEPLRETSTTIDFSSAVHEKIYEIPFDSRREFEALWPVILTLKTPEAPLRLNDPSFTSSGDVQRAMVRIYAPTDATVKVRNREDIERKAAEDSSGDAARASDPSDRFIHAGPPWPETVIAEDGVLPEYVRAATVDGERTWVPADRNDHGFRARTEIELIVDGKIIDLNRIALPPDTPILDRRTTTAPLQTHRQATGAAGEK